MPTGCDAADINADGVTNTQDTTKFLSWHAAADPRADWNHDGSVNTTDISAYLNDWVKAGTFGGRGVLSSLALDIRFGYAGYRWDQQLNKYHARHRVYDPATGRWLNRDPIEYDGGTWNLYEYVAGSPVRAYDPFGLDIWIESTPSVHGLHRRICVDTWNADGTKGTPFCISFGANNAGICHQSSDCSGSSSGSSGSSSSCSGSNSSSGGHDDGGIYFDDPIATPRKKIIRRRKQTPKQDKKTLHHFLELNGEDGDYNVVTFNCRVFCTQLFDNPDSDPVKKRKDKKHTSKKPCTKWVWRDSPLTGPHKVCVSR